MGAVLQNPLLLSLLLWLMCPGLCPLSLLRSCSWGGRLSFSPCSSE